MFTILEIYNEDTADLRSINHHGSERKVVDKNIAELKNKKNGFMQKQTNLGNIARFVGKGRSQKINKKKVWNFPYFFYPPLWWGKVWTLFMILFNIQGSNLCCF